MKKEKKGVVTTENIYVKWKSESYYWKLSLEARKFWIWLLKKVNPKLKDKSTKNESRRAVCNF